MSMTMDDSIKRRVAKRMAALIIEIIQGKPTSSVTTNMEGTHFTSCSDCNIKQYHAISRPPNLTYSRSNIIENPCG